MVGAQYVNGHKKANPKTKKHWKKARAQKYRSAKRLLQKKNYCKKAMAQKLKGWIIGLGPCRTMNWTGLNSNYDHLVWS
jgi:hypothetical protein